MTLNSNLQNMLTATAPSGNVINAIGNSKIGVGTATTSILTIRNKTTFNGQPNTVPVYVTKYTTAVEGNDVCFLYLIKNATLGGVPSYTDIDTATSVVEYDIAGTTVTGGLTLDGDSIGKTGRVIDKPPKGDITLSPGDTLTVGVAIITLTVDVTSFIKWVEDF